jgi:hypothetical protein
VLIVPRARECNRNPIGNSCAAVKFTRNNIAYPFVCGLCGMESGYHRTVRMMWYYSVQSDTAGEKIIFCSSSCSLTN